mgnify:CR=1 FL=1
MRPLLRPDAPTVAVAVALVAATAAATGAVLARGQRRADVVVVA